MTFIILDLILVFILIVAVIISSKRGFVRTLIEVLGSIAVIYLCLTLSSPVADFVYSKTIEPGMVKSVEENIESSAEKTTDAVWNALPDIVKNNSGLFGVTKSSLDETISVTEDSATKLANKAVDSVAKPVIVRFISLILSVLSIIILLFLVKLLARALNKIFSFSILGSINRFLGGILGIIKGLVVCVLFVMVIALLKSITKSDLGIFSKENIQNTYIFKIIYGALPFFK